MTFAEKVVLITNSIKLHEILGEPTTRHSIAKDIKSISRSTVYRVVRRAHELKLLGYTLNHSGDNEYYITDKGFDLIVAQKDLM